MYFYKKLYVGPSIDDPHAIKSKLFRGAGQMDLYVLMLSPGRGRKNGNQLEFCHCVNLQQPYYRENPPFIIGIARGRREMIELVSDIVSECYMASGDADVIRYLFPHGIRIHRKKSQRTEDIQ